MGETLKSDENCISLLIASTEFEDTLGVASGLVEILKKVEGLFNLEEYPPEWIPIVEKRFGSH